MNPDAVLHLPDVRALASRLHSVACIDLPDLASRPIGHDVDKSSADLVAHTAGLIEEYEAWCRTHGVES